MLQYNLLSASPSGWSKWEEKQGGLSVRQRFSGCNETPNEKQRQKKRKKEKETRCFN